MKKNLKGDSPQKLKFRVDLGGRGRGGGGQTKNPPWECGMSMEYD